MNDKERVEWLKALTVIWGVPLGLILITQWAPEPEPEDVLIVAGIVSTSGTVLYLLILSWRLAYLRGRKKR